MLVMIVRQDQSKEETESKQASKQASGASQAKKENKR